MSCFCAKSQSIDSLKQVALFTNDPVDIYTLAQTFCERGDSANCLLWHEKNLATKYPKSQFEIGNMYRKGKGVNRDYAKAFSFFLLSAKQGNAYAQNNLGYMYEKGFGCNQSDKKSFKWYKKSAINNDDLAQANLGTKLLYGIGCKTSIDEALYWLLKSAETGNSFGQLQLASYYLEYPNEQNLQKAFEYLSIVSKSDDSFFAAEAKCDLGMMYLNGEFVNPDTVKAFSLVKESHLEGSSFGTYQLANFYSDGIGVAIDSNRAFELYYLAAESGEVDAMYELALFYEYSSWKNDREAFNWYERCYSLGDLDCAYFLALCYIDGVGVAKDFEKAMHLLKECKRSGDRMAEIEIMTMHANGIGVKKNRKKANRMARSLGYNNYQNCINSNISKF